MVIKLLGLIDVVAGLIILFYNLGLASQVALLFGVFLIIKGLLFFDFIGFFDILLGVFMVFGLINDSGFFSWLFVVWLLQKGFFSLF